MLELVDTLEEFTANVLEYQRAVDISHDPHQCRGRITPSLVRDWYYVPALDLVAACRFIGYKGMNREHYEQSSEIDGRVAQPHLQRKGWFRPLEEDEPQYRRARSLAEGIRPAGRVYHSAKFYVLTKACDEQVRKVLQQTISSIINNVKTVNPASWPQYPFDTPPEVPESSKPTYDITSELDIFIPMRDGVKLAADVFRPSAPGRKFPGLIGVSPYTRQLQRTVSTDGQNESGVTAFWVPRGYAHIIVDVRGTNDSEGSWEHMGPTEQRDLYDMIEWVAQQPWCDGNVGMTGESYFGWSQLMAATQRPPHLKAIFPLLATVDLYRERFYHGGIFHRGVGGWFRIVRELNGRAQDPSGIVQQEKSTMRMECPFDGPYWQERLSWTRLDRVQIPAYFGGLWPNVGGHLRSAFEGWDGVGQVPKRMLVGLAHRPPKPMGVYHQEALRWYDHHLKGMDTRVMEGPPIQLYIPGRDQWRGEYEWPLARTQWREFLLAGESGKTRKLADSAGADGTATYDYDPSTIEAYRGVPGLIYRSEPVGQDMEVTGPLALTLWASSTARDTDWFVAFNDEAPDGQVRELTKGWLRASHRELDESRSKPWRPFHPHLQAAPLTPNEACEFAIEIWPTSNLFKAGHRLRLEIASSDDQSKNSACHQAVLLPARNTILEGRSHPSRLLVPVVPLR